MAIWQCDFQLVPSGMAENLELEDCWAKYSINKNSLKKLGEVLPDTKSWSEDIIQYGRNDDTCVQLFCEKSIVVEIRIRISFRDIDTEKIKAICDFAKHNDGMLYFNKKIILPEMNEIINVIKNSDSSRFCLNPTEYLINLNK